MANPEVERRKGSDRRLTFTQTPYVADFLDQVSKDTGISRADLLNTAIQVLAVAYSRYRDNMEWVVRDEATGQFREEPALQVLLGDILSSLPRNDREDAHRHV